MNNASDWCVDCNKQLWLVWCALPGYSCTRTQATCPLLEVAVQSVVQVERASFFTSISSKIAAVILMTYVVLLPLNNTVFRLFNQCTAWVPHGGVLQV
jgi:hypothetical protein